MVDAVVEFDYAAQEDDELSLKAGDVITNVNKVSDGWCEGVLNGRKGMFPDNFVKEIKKETKSAVPAKRPNAGNISDIRNKLSSVINVGGPPPQVARKPPKRAKVTFPYTPQQSDELALEVGSIIEILKQDEPNWWEGTVNGKVGMFPSNFVEVLGQGEGEKIASDEAPVIRGRKVEGVGFGNIFAGGQIVLRSKLEKKDSVDPTNVSAEKGAEQKLPLKMKPPVPALPPAVSSQQTATVAPLQQHAQLPLTKDTKPVQKARVVYPYSAANDDELDLNEGDVIVILDQNLEDEGWWKGEVNGKVGVFPDNFVELLPLDLEKSKRPTMPSSNGASFKGSSASSVTVTTNDPKKASFTKKEETKPAAAVVIKQELKPNSEMDDFKIKKGFVKTGTLDSVKTNESALAHPTAGRAKPPVRRPPTAPMSARESSAAMTAQDERHLTSTDVNHAIADSSRPTEQPHPSGHVTREQFNELQREVVQLRESIEQTKKANEKQFFELTADLEEEKRAQKRLQSEVNRLKKALSLE